MTGNCRKQPTLPRKFKEEFQGKLLEVVNLRGPSGNLWQMELVQIEDDFVLRNGWGKFAKDHNLKQDHLLVFRYYKDSTFDVLIFDPSECETESCYFVVPNGKARSMCYCHNLVDSNSSTDGMSKGHNFDANEETPISGSSDEEKVSEMDEDYKQFFLSILQKSGRVSGKNSGDGVDKNLFFFPMSYISGRRAITEDDKRRAHSLAKNHSSKRPFFRTMLHPTNVCHNFTLRVGRKFGDHLPNNAQEIQLRVPPESKTWSVQFNAGAGPQQCTVGTGWADFVLDNNLEVHDYCVMELTYMGSSSRKPLLDVFIYRAVEQVVPLKKYKLPSPLR